MVDRAHPECTGDPALLPVHASRSNSPCRPVGLPGPQPQTYSGHADPSLSVRNPSRPSREKARGWFVLNTAVMSSLVLPFSKNTSMEYTISST